MKRRYDRAHRVARRLPSARIKKCLKSSLVTSSTASFTAKTMINRYGMTDALASDGENTGMANRVTGTMQRYALATRRLCQSSSKID
eukprot:3414567-Pyramimonas_sp.AAC.1